MSRAATEDLGALLSANPDVLAECETADGESRHALARQLSEVVLPETIGPIVIDREEFVIHDGWSGRGPRTSA